MWWWAKPCRFRETDQSKKKNTYKNKQQFCHPALADVCSSIPAVEPEPEPLCPSLGDGSVLPVGRWPAGRKGREDVEEGRVWLRTPDQASKGPRVVCILPTGSRSFFCKRQQVAVIRCTRSLPVERSSITKDSADSALFWCLFSKIKMEVARTIKMFLKTWHFKLLFSVLPFDAF